MSCTYTIMKRYGLAYIRIEGIARPRDSLDALQRFAKDPEASADLNQLIDLGGVTGMKMDVIQLFRMHARKADIFTVGERDRLFVHIAPTPIARKVAGYVVRSWDGVPGITHRMVETEEQALAILGLKERSVAALMRQQA